MQAIPLQSEVGVLHWVGAQFDTVKRRLPGYNWHIGLHVKLVCDFEVDPEI